MPCIFELPSHAEGGVFFFGFFASLFFRCWPFAMIFLLVFVNLIKNRYDSFNCTFDFLPGAAGGVYPAIRLNVPSILFPCTNRIEWQTIISLLAASSDNCRRTLERDMPVALAISVSNPSLCSFRYSRTAFICALPYPSFRWSRYCTLTPKAM